MTENYGGLKNAYVMIGKETVEGSMVTANRVFGINTEVTPDITNEIVTSRGLKSRSLDQIQIGTFLSKVDLTGEYQNGRLLEYALGGVAHSGASDPYTHTFTEADTIPSFTMEVGLDGTVDDVEKYVGCKINSYTLAMDLKGVLTQRAEILSQKPFTSTSASSYTKSTLPTLPWAVGQYKVGAAGSETEVAQCRAFELTATNTLEAIEKWNSYVPVGHFEGERNYSGKVTLAFTDANERSRFFGGTIGTTTPASADFDGFSVVVAIQKSVSRALTLTLSDVHYTHYSKPITAGGLILQEFDITCATAGVVTKDDISSANW